MDGSTGTRVIDADQMTLEPWYWLFFAVSSDPIVRLDFREAPQGHCAEGDDKSRVDHQYLIL